MATANVYGPGAAPSQMKLPDKQTLQEPLLNTERAIESALRCDFDSESCVHLATCLSQLLHLIIEEDTAPPIVISDAAALSAKVLIMIDVAYCCWRNDGAAVPLPEDVLMNHVARMKLNPAHCKTVLDFTRLFLHKHDRLLSVESATLLLP